MGESMWRESAYITCTPKNCFYILGFPEETRESSLGYESSKFSFRSMVALVIL